MWNSKNDIGFRRWISSSPFLLIKIVTLAEALNRIVELEKENAKLKGELAERQSIFIMRAFKEMRHFIAHNALMFEKINSIELKQFSS